MLLASLAAAFVAVLYNAARRSWPSCTATTRDMEYEYQDRYSRITLAITLIGLAALAWLIYVG